VAARGRFLILAGHLVIGWLALFLAVARLGWRSDVAAGIGLGGSVDGLRRILLTRAFLIPVVQGVVHGGAGVVGFGVALRIAPLVIGLFGRFAYAEVWREHTGQGRFEVEALAKPITQREEAGSHQQQRSHQVDGTR